MPLDSRERAALASIAGMFTGELRAQRLREDMGMELLRLLRADYFVSYVWEPSENAYRSRASVNMDPANLERYEEYFQFHDPLTPRMARQPVASIVDRVMDRGELESSEFYNDFLARDGLCYGLNYFASDRDGQSLGDLRVWRSRRSGQFDEDDRLMLDVVGRALRTQLVFDAADTPALPAQVADVLSRRERDVVDGVAAGLGDRDIAGQLHISQATVRTHLAHIFTKLDVHSRTQLLAVVRGENQRFR